MTSDASDVILEAGPARATIALRGAEWRSWTIAGVDLLWPGDPAVWAATAPILFPVVGWTRNGRVRVGNQTYPLGLHGFAASSAFEIALAERDRAVLVLEDGPATRTLYPFSFRLDVEYRLTASCIEVALTVRNGGGTAMPYAIGLHPGFRWPFCGSRAQHKIAFSRAERGDVPVITPDGLFSRQRRAVPIEGPVLNLDPTLFASEALCFLDIASRQLLYDNGAGQGLLVSLDDFPHVAFWARPPAPFIAIEAWTGHGDPDDFGGDLFDKPSMIILPPGARRRHGVGYEFLADPSPLRGGLHARPHLPKGL
ncbi:MAG: aldose 1-epimerase family protein [Beijerinckiaceae bacterium]